ncbi:MAG: sensory rhodopsin transducer [Phycisphaerales bacterium]
MINRNVVEGVASRLGRGARSLLSSAGQASAQSSFEALEPRILLSGDHPGFDEVFPDSGPATLPTEIVLTSGFGVAFGQIEDVPNDTGDFFRFTASTSGFVSVLAADLSTPGQTALNTAVEVYLPNGTELTGDSDGLNNGTLARAGLVSDGWHGFVAQAGQEYYIRVIGENRDQIDGPGGEGNYSISINAAVTTLALDANGVARTGTNTPESLGGGQQDLLYTFTTPDDPSYNSLGYALTGDIVFGSDANGYATAPDADRDLVDTRVEIYDENGLLIAADSESGHIWDAFALARFEADSTYYIRVRSDAITTDLQTDPQTGSPDDVNAGQFELRVQARATDIALDSDSRIAVVDRSSSGISVDDLVTPTSVDPAGLLRDQHSAQIFAFDSLGEGTAFINFFTYAVLDPSAPVPPIGRFLDANMEIFDDGSGTAPIETSDSLVPFDGFQRPGVVLQVAANQRYYVLINAFDGQFLGTGVAARDAAATEFDYRLVVEAPLTLDLADDEQPVDDHFDLLRLDDGDATTEDPIRADLVRQFATPLVWGSAVVPVGWVSTADDGADENGNGTNDGYSALGVTQMTTQVTDHSRVTQAFALGRLHNAGDTDVFQFVPQVDMIGAFEGALGPLPTDPPTQVPLGDNDWYDNGRPASRLTINVFFDSEWYNFGGTGVQVYDSNFELVEESMLTPITSVNGGLVNPLTRITNPSGIESPSLLGPAPTTNELGEIPKNAAAVNLNAQYWGGEAYYIVISGLTQPTRYSMVVQADAFDSDASQWAFDIETPEDGDFGNAAELTFSPDGLATNRFDNENTGAVRLIPLVESGIRFENDNPPDEPIGGPDIANGFFDNILYTGQLGMIHSSSDTDIYRFTAQRGGTAEITVGTLGISDAAQEIRRLGNTPVDILDQLTKVYNSPLDAAIRVYDSAGNQIAFSNNFNGYGGGSTGTFFSAGNPVTFTRKDPRVVIDIEQGQDYFVVVESSQRNVAAGDVDHRVATGSYQLFVNATPNAGGTDDHGDFPVGFFGTVIPANGDPSQTNNNIGTVSGRIEIENDSDGFDYVAPRAGTVNFTLDPEAGLSLSLFIIDGAGNIVPLINSTALDGELLVGSFVATQGERFRLLVGGLGGTGSYTLTLAGQDVQDDAVDQGSFGAGNAEAIPFGPFDRTVEVSGVIDDAADTDLYRFIAPVTDPITLTLSPASGSPFFSGSVIVYEISSDPGLTASPVQNAPVRTPIAYELNPDERGTITVRFSTQANREYHVLVRGSNDENATGGYDLNLTYTPEDDHADLGDLPNASFINVVPSTGQGSITGILEQINDSDLFVFGTPASGPVDISLVWNPVPGATFEMRLFDVDGNLLDPDGVLPQDTFASSSGFLAIDSFTASAAEIYYIAVLGPTAVDISYTLNVNTGLIDDHANEGDFENATVIPLAFSTGDGFETGRLEVDDDTDLFTFGVRDGGTVDVTISASVLGNPVLRVFDSTGTLVSTTLIPGGISFTNTTGDDQQFFVSVGSTFPGPRSGVYQINVDGPPVPPAPGDDHANEGDLANATVLNVSSITGNASVGGVINAVDGDPVIDTDLFRYTSTGEGPVFVQVSAPGTPTPDFRIRVFDASGVEITSLADADGVAGTPRITAATSFEVAGAGETYYFVVESANGVDAGAYALNVDGSASISTVFYPEGFANARIREFVAISNPNDEAVSYTIRVYYADPTLGSAVVASGTLAADARGGATLSFGGDVDGDGNADFAPGIIPNEAYAISIESSLRVAASMSRYDSGLTPLSNGRGPGSIGETFTDQLSNEWLFPRIEKNPGIVAQFLVYFNPNAFDVDITVTAFTASGVVSLPTSTLGANQRGGLEIHNTAALPLGTYAIQVSSVASDPANEGNNIGIVAATSRYGLVDNTAYGYLGVFDGGSSSSVVPSLVSGAGTRAEISLFNPDLSNSVVVTITGSYLTDAALPDLVRTITLNAGEQRTFTGTQLAFVPNSPIGLRLTTAGAPIAVSAVETQRGDTVAAAAATQAGTAFFFGDAFLNPTQAGTLYSESLTLYNPSSADTNVSVTFFFADGTAQRTLSRMIEAQEFLRLQLEDLPEVVGARPALNYFSIRVESTSAIISQLTHFDGFLGGGWATGGAPLGLTSPIA